MNDLHRGKSVLKLGLLIPSGLAILLGMGPAACSVAPVNDTSFPTLLPADTEFLSSYKIVDLPPAQLSTLGSDSPNPYLVTTTSKLWERLGANFGALNTPITLPDATTDLWERLRTGFTLSARQSKQVRQEAKNYSESQESLDVIIERARPYLHYVLEEIEKRGMPSELALVPIIESAYQPLAYSHGGAAGLWQFIPSTGRNFGLKQTFWYDGRRDIIASTNAALDYLQKLNNDFNGDWLLALAAYNCGEGTVMKARKRNRAAGKPGDFWSLDLPREAEGYVPRLLGVAALVANPEDFGASLSVISDEPVVSTVQLKSQVDLSVAARMAGISAEEIKVLNPGFIHGTSDPKGPHQLLLPISKIDSFNARLASLEFGKLMPDAADGKAAKKSGKTGDKLSKAAKNTAKDTPAGVTEVSYTVRTGDTLARIAKHFNMNSTQLKKWNAAQFQAKKLKAGRTLKLFIDPTRLTQTLH